MCSIDTPFFADMDGDGRLDVGAGNELWLGNGDATFLPPFEIAFWNSTILAQDFNGDRRTDVAWLGFSVDVSAERYCQIEAVSGRLAG